MFSTYSCPVQHEPPKFGLTIFDSRSVNIVKPERKNAAPMPGSDMISVRYNPTHVRNKNEHWIWEDKQRKRQLT